jgi:hypothetical protein
MSINVDSGGDRHEIENNDNRTTEAMIQIRTELKFGLRKNCNRNGVFYLHTYNPKRKLK